MNIVRVRIASLILGACLAVTGSAAPKLDSPWAPSALTMAQLPQYCWAQYNEDFKRQSGVKSPVEMCGTWMNHFCPGLVYLNNARNPGFDKGQRRMRAQQALGEVRYTLQHMPKGCALAGDVEAARVQIETLLKILQ